MARAVGIDLGTTNSVVAVLEGGEPTVIANAEGSRTTPSVVAFAKNGEVLVGEVAKRQAVTNVDRTIRSVKRHMGTDWTDRHRRQELHPAADQRPRPAEAQARRRGLPRRDRHRRGHHRPGVLQRRPAPGHQGGRRDRRPQRAAHHQRADRGGARLRPGQGREASRPSSSSTSAAARSTCPCSRSAGEDGFSVEVKATTGDNHLGGDDWDQRVVDHLVTQFKNGNGVDLSKDKMALQRLREAAEKAKIELSSSTETTINLPYITARAEGPLHLDEKLTRARVPAADLRPARPLQGPVPATSSRTPASRSPRSTTSCSSAARPGCPPSSTWSAS